MNQTKSTTTDMSSFMEYGCVATAFLIPIKLSLTYVVLIPLIMFWILKNGPRCIVKEVRERLPREIQSWLLAPLGFFLLVVLVHSVLGIDPLHSIRPYISLCFFALSLLLFLLCSSGRPALLALLAGQSVAALHSCIESALPSFTAHFGVRNVFIGKVTESGQLALSCLLACGFAFSAYESDKTRLEYSPFDWTRAMVLFALATVALTTFSFSRDFHFTGMISGIVFALACSLLAVGAWLCTRCPHRQRKIGICVLTICLPLLSSALLVNLKRGPLLGVMAASTVFFLFMAPRVSRWILLASIAIVLTVEPIRERLAVSLDHFFITGGRSTIWRIGSELATKLPTGLGFHNSQTLRQFAPEIPSELKHFHNNALNIVAENGWLGLAIFVWLIAGTLVLCFKDRTNTLRIAVGCAILSWQVAGLVEYNFGDSEVLLLVWAMLGSSFALKASKETAHC